MKAILVKTCQHFRARREAIEETWAKDIREAGHFVWFTEGGHPKPSTTDKQILVVAPDTYDKTARKLHQAFEAIDRYYSEVEQLFIVDDDTFVHPRRWLVYVPTCKFECHVYQPKDDEDRRRNRGQGWALGGAGWWMNRSLRRRYVQRNQADSWDDIAATRIAMDAKALIKNCPHLYGGDRYVGLNDRVAADNQFITSHHVLPDEMRSLYEATSGL